MMTNIDRAEMTGRDGGRRRWRAGLAGRRGGGAVLRRTCRDAPHGSRASLRLAAQWPTGNGERNGNIVTDNGGHGDGQT